MSWEKAELERIMSERAVNELETLEERFEAKYALLSSSKQFEIEIVMAENEISELSQQIERQAVTYGASGSGAVELSTAIKLSSSIASKRNRIKYRRRQSPY